MSCFCCINLQNPNLTIFTTALWTVQLNKVQCYLGWCEIVLNRHMDDFTDITKEEQDELFVIIKKLKLALTRSFQSDKFNFSVLGNTANHVHMHFIPRYKNERNFKNTTFVDARWGHNYAPYNKDFKITEQVKNFIITKIKSNL